MAGGGLAFLIYSIVQLVCYVWASRKSTRLPVAATAAHLWARRRGRPMSAVVNSAIGGWIGLIVSGISFLIAFAVLLVVFERDQLNRAWRLIRGDFSFRDPDARQATDGRVELFRYALACHAALATRRRTPGDRTAARAP